MVFRPIQRVCLNLFGYKAHKVSVDWLQFFLMRSLNVLGTHFSFYNPYPIDTKQSLIMVSNHQSMYDIPPLIWYMRKHHPKFISEKELGKGIPNVSFNLRLGGSVLIDCKDVLQSVKALKTFAHRVKNNNWAAHIFPESTRSRTEKQDSLNEKDC